MYRKTLFIVLVIALLALIPLGLTVAQDDGPPAVTVEIGSINDDDFPELTLFVNVRDQYGVPVPDLTIDDFQVLLGDESAQVLSVENITRDELPISVVLVIDTSDSMYGDPLADAQVAALTFLDRLAPGDEVALVDFDSTVKVAQDFTSDLDSVRAAIDGLFADRRTALYEAVYQSTGVALNASTPRRFVVFLTDGNEFGSLSTHSAAEGIELAAGANVPFYVIGLGYGVDRTYLSNLGAETRGRTYFYPDSTTLAEVYDYLANYLRTQYIVRIGTTLEPDGQPRELALSVAEGSATTTYTPPDFYPQVTIEGLSEEPFAEPVEVGLRVDAVRGINTNQVSVDDVPQDVTFERTGEVTSTASITLDPYAFEPGVEHTVTLTAVDAQGGARAVTATFTVADLPPVIQITGLDEGALVSAGTVDVSVAVEQAQQPVQQVIYRVDGQDVVSLAEPPYAHPLNVLPFGPGNHTFEVVLVDASGETVVSRGFVVDPQLFVTPTATPTNTPTPTDTPTPTHTPTPTDTPTPTATHTSTPTATDTPTVTPSPIPTDTPAPTDTPVPTHTPTPTEDVSATAVALALNLTSTAESWTDTPVPTDTPTVTPVPTDTPVPSDTPEPSATDTPVSSDTPEPSATDTPVPTDTPEPSETDTPEPTTTAAPSETPVITPTVAMVEQQVEPDEESGRELQDYLPICIGIAVVLLVLIAAYFLLRRPGQPA